MTQRDNILQELNGLQSSLATLPPRNVYTVPEGYFDNLAATVLDRIRVQENETSSPLLSSLSKQMPYTVPQGYFEELGEKMLQAVRESHNPQSAKEELESLSPLLSSLKKEMPYSVPQGYFENLETKPAATRAKLVSFSSRKWFRYAAAAVTVGIVATIALLFINQDKRPSEKQILAKVNKEVNKMNEAEKEKLADFLKAGLNGSETVQVSPDKTNDFKEFMKDIPEDELKAFSEQNEDLRDLLQISE